LDKELKKELRRNDFADAMANARAFFMESDGARPVIGLVLLVVALSGLYSFQRYRARTAEAAFSKAVELYHAEVGGTAPAGGTAYATAATKFTAARDAFDEIARSYPSQPAGRRARYYAALSRLELGETAAAESELAAIAAVRDPGAIEPGLARLALADLALRSGKAKDAAARFQALADDPASGVPRDRSLLGLAESLEAAGDKVKARDAYETLAHRFPDSPYATAARTRVSSLTAAL
jgi:TolA-binding protein